MDNLKEDLSPVLGTVDVHDGDHGELFVYLYLPVFVAAHISKGQSPLPSDHPQRPQWPQLRHMVYFNIFIRHQI